MHDERERVGRARCHDQLGSVAFARFQEARAAGRPESELLAALNAALAAYQQALALLPANAVNDLAVTHNATRRDLRHRRRHRPRPAALPRVDPPRGRLRQPLRRRNNPLQRRVGPVAIGPADGRSRVRPRRPAELRTLRPRRRGHDATHAAVARPHRTGTRRVGAALTRLLRRAAWRQPAGSSLTLIFHLIFHLISPAPED